MQTVLTCFPDGQQQPLYDILLDLSKSEVFDDNKKIYSKLDGKIKFVEGAGVEQKYFKEGASVEEGTSVEDEGDWYLIDESGNKKIITDTELDVTTTGTIQFSAKETEFNKHHQRRKNCKNILNTNYNKTIQKKKIKNKLLKKKSHKTLENMKNMLCLSFCL